MTSRDLLQQRTTLPNGDTVWRPSSLVVAALQGHLAVLDGIHRINPGTLSVLQRFVKMSLRYFLNCAFESLQVEVINDICKLYKNSLQEHGNCSVI